MTILILDENPDYSRVVSDVLSGMGFDVRRTADARALVRGAEPTDIILATADRGLDNLDTLMRALRQDPERTNLPVLALANDSTQRNAEFASLIARLRNVKVLRRDLSLLDLGDQLRQMQELDGPAPAEAADHVGPMLLLFGAIWCQEESGVLTTPDGRSGLIVQGAADPATMDLIEDALKGTARVRFERTGHRGSGDSSQLGRLLWTHAGQQADPNFALSQLDLALQPVLWLDRISDLAVMEEIPRLVSTANGQTPLRAHLASLGMDPTRVGRQLSMLAKLGLLKLSPVRIQPPDAAARRIEPTPLAARPEPRPAPAKPPESRPVEPPPAEPSRATPRPLARPVTRGATPHSADPNEGLLLLKRLRKEVQNLASADAWTVLGIAPTRDVEELNVAAQRLRHRYSKIASERRDSDEIVRLCSAMLAQIDDALRRATRRVEQVTESAGVSDSERLFQAGKEAASEGRWSLAVRALRVAHRMQVDSAPYQAWLGWAIFNDTARGERRLDEALELLELADSFQPDLAEGQLFLARVELYAGKVERAVARLDRLSKQHPGTEGLEQARRLARDKLSELQSQGEK